MGVIAKGILRGCQGLFTPVSLGYPLSVFNKNSTLRTRDCVCVGRRGCVCVEGEIVCVCVCVREYACV